MSLIAMLTELHVPEKLRKFYISRENFLNKSIQEAASPSLHEEFLALIKRADLYGTYRKEITFKLKGRQLHVAATITSNPVPLKDKSEYLIVLDDLTELITTKNMHDRKVIMYEKSDGFIIIPGGFGTMDEFFEISTWGQLGLHSKPIGILNMNGFYDDLLKQGQKMVDKGFLAQANFDAILVSDEISDLLHKMINFKPLPKPEWLNLDRL